MPPPQPPAPETDEGRGGDEPPRREKRRERVNPTTTAQRVFDLAMGLIDEVNESSGETDTSDTREYKVRTLLILNTLRGELFP